MKQKITLLVVLFIVSISFAQKTFVLNGNWNQAGNWSPSGVPTLGDDVTINPGVTCFLSITGAVANSVIVQGTLSVSAGASLTVSGLLTQNGTMTISSDASNSGSVIVNGGQTGNITYQRYLTANPNWHMFSAPVQSQTIASFISSFGGNMSTSGVNYSLAPYDNAFTPDGSSTWIHYTTDISNPPPASAFVIAKGYEIRMDVAGTVNFTGILSIGTFPITLTESSSPGTRWNLIGNPYSSSIFGNVGADATNNFLTVNSAQLDPSFVSMYIWNPGNSSYDIMNQITGARSLAPGQAFFVNSKTGGGTANFTSAMRTH